MALHDQLLRAAVVNGIAMAFVLGGSVLRIGRPAAPRRIGGIALVIGADHNACT